MQAADVFYNREDLWQFPRQPVGDGGTAPMVPYYIIMRLPGETQAEFFIMIPMVPSRRDNMIAWLAARCDAPDYGKLIVYEFPKEKLVYGPFQIEARIHQNTEISQQISLWNQMGSRVIRGNLLVIPIENSILYISPLYLRAEQGHLPELKRVIAAYGEHVVMKETLAEALSALFVETSAAPATPDAATEEVEVWGLGRLRQADRRDARSFGGREPAIGRSLRCVGGFINAKTPSDWMSIPPNFARPSRRGDRVKIGTSEFGTNAKCRPALKLSAYRGGSEVIGARSERRD
jgi:uncharacterized membrane protein (UPF0182 family)